MFINFSVTVKQITDVVKFSIIHQRHTSGDNIDVVTDCKFRKFQFDFFGEFSQFKHTFSFRKMVERRKQRRVEKFREQNKIRFVICHYIHEKFHLFIKCIDGFEMPHLPLYQPKSDHRILHGIWFFAVINVVPLQQNRIFL